MIKIIGSCTSLLFNSKINAVWIFHSDTIKEYFTRIFFRNFPSFFDRSFRTLLNANEQPEVTNDKNSIN